MMRQGFSSLRSDSNVVPRGYAWSLAAKLAIFIWIWSCTEVEAQNVTAEMEALLAFQFPTSFSRLPSSSSGPTRGFWDTWRKTDKSPCKWIGISCTSNGSVRSIDLSGWGESSLVSTDPSELRHLENLEQLILADNQISDYLFVGIDTLTNLRHLDLSGNSFTENLPPSLNQLENLRFLYLDRNNFTGGIPLLDNLTQLQVLSLSRNRLDGPIPDHLNKLTSLVSLDLSNNMFNGTIPVLTSLANLDELNLENNQLTGFRDPRFPGPRSLKHLLASDNRLGGTLPIGLTEMLQLRVVDMSSNLFSGRMPTGVGPRTNYRRFWLDLSQNLLEGSIPGDLFLPPACDSSPLAWCSSYLNLSYNKLSGSIPEVPLQNTDNFDFTLDLSHNQLTGSLPTQILSNNSGINKLRLEANQLSGDMVDVLLELRTNEIVRDVGLAHNHFTGDLTRMIGKWTLLLDFIEYVDLSDNLLTMSKTENYTDPMRSTLEEVFSSTWLVEFRIAGNNFEGVSLPEEISLGKLKESNDLEVLDVSNNHLVGSISEGVYSASNLPAIMVLNFSGNNLTGPVPYSITRLPTLITLDVSRNNLSGRLPDIPPNSTLWDSNLFAGNPWLSGGPLPPPPSTVIVVKGNGLSKGALSVIVLSALLVPLASCWIVGWRWKVYKKLHKQDADLIATLLEREKTALMPLRDLKRATDNFAESAQIGEGGFGTVYTGKLQDGTVVAIKRNKREGTEASKQQFLNEVRVLSQVSHRHLVKLLGCCMENKTALLVFEFVPNGTLQEHLRGKKGSGLSWKQRLEIAVQTADALNYLHSAAQFPIVHRDVKSANILLTEKLQVKVADFGISKLASPEAAEATHFSTVAIQGTIGYIDPEYFTSCQLTVKSDVYSFGIVLLELISAQSVIDFQRPSGDSSLITFAAPLIRNQELESLIDPILMDSLDSLKKSVLGVGTLALQCLQDKSKDRPDMKEVWKQLQTAWLSYNQVSADFVGSSFSIDGYGESNNRSTDSSVLLTNSVDSTSFWSKEYLAHEFLQVQRREPRAVSFNVSA